MKSVDPLTSAFSGSLSFGRHRAEIEILLFGERPELILASSHRGRPQECATLRVPFVVPKPPAVGGPGLEMRSQESGLAKVALQLLRVREFGFGAWGVFVPSPVKEVSAVGGVQVPKVFAHL
jgi:hypothetical protein